MITILVCIMLGVMAVGVVAGVLIFGIGMLGTALVWGIKLGICIIPILIGVLLAKTLFGI
jgi:hypothetical protein